MVLPPEIHFYRMFPADVLAAFTHALPVWDHYGFRLYLFLLCKLLYMLLLVLFFLLIPCLFFFLFCLMLTYVKPILGTYIFLMLC